MFIKFKKWHIFCFIEIMIEGNVCILDLVIFFLPLVSIHLLSKGAKLH